MATIFKSSSINFIDEIIPKNGKGQSNVQKKFNSTIKNIFKIQDLNLDISIIIPSNIPDYSSEKEVEITKIKESSKNEKI
jgi:hypothetical protein